ncbi:hypothetical protein [uncultured Paludibaculum sp.]|uniref:hypothetical protein n=1 Tax=uncultured Paludibaculum sp. TaxID=1765020 RepID=UPI002AABA6F7|nr:hypothetical protein [uncultured Paludibaculum sp.]
MSFFSKVRALVSDPPPDFVFEVSGAGIAWAQPKRPAAIEWAPLPPGAVVVSPLENNVREPEVYSAAVRALVSGPDGKPKQGRAALILPDYCARVAVVDFDTFPADPQEQLQLARFRVKRVVPFDIESAIVVCYPQQRAGAAKKIDVVVVVVNMDVASHLEAPFRAAGFQCGYVTISALSALALPGEDADEHASPVVVAKLCGDVLSVSLIEGRTLRMFRCVQLHGGSEQEATDVLATTFAYAEDELGARPKVLRQSGVARENEALVHLWSQEFGLPVSSLRSRFGAPGAYNAGLHGYLEMTEAH